MQTKQRSLTHNQKELYHERILSILLYVKGITDRIGRILNKHNIRTIFKSPEKIGQILRNPKNQTPPLNSAEVYKILCSCEQVYIGETRRMINLRIKKHQRDIRLKHINQHSIKTQHRNRISNTV